ncbi:MAG: hypothetical protein O6918_01850, partial [Deltaproteobacteria bacterium]|nr:hypothetical protein [Deltaproteobacteria bacterium]
SGVVDATNLSDPQSDFGSFSAALPGWLIVSDEKRRFLREVIARLGQDRLVTTAGLLVLAIQANIIFVKKADQMKKILVPGLDKKIRAESPWNTECQDESPERAYRQRDTWRYTDIGKTGQRNSPNSQTGQGTQGASGDEVFRHPACSSLSLLPLNRDYRGRIQWPVPGWG